jgi:hypothetical protein
LAPSVGRELLTAEAELLLHPTDTPDTEANWGAFGGIVLKRLDGGHYDTVYRGGSDDLCHVVEGESEGPLLPGAVGVHNPLYDLARGCGGEPPALRLVGVKNSSQGGLGGEPQAIGPCTVELGVATYGLNGGIAEQHSASNAIAAGGREIFFTTGVNPTCEEGLHQLFVRLDGSRTVEVSKPWPEPEPLKPCEEVPCEGATVRPSAYFKGASEDGSRVFFTTSAPLVGEDKNEGNDLYMARIGCPGGEGEECKVAERGVTSLVQVSHDSTSGQVAGVQGVARVAPDGARVYFVAHGVLSEANVEGRAPVNGAENLYVYDAETEKLAFVADLKVGEGQLTGQSTADGRFFVFSTYAHLLKGDTGAAGALYRYDAGTGLLDRVSLGEDGYDANGNDSAFGASIANDGLGPSVNDRVYEQYESTTRAVSEDGSRVVFTSAGPLSPLAINGFANVYEWHKEPGWSEGVVSLVSSGSSTGPDFGAAISPSGRDIFFATLQGLVPQDTEGEVDIYDARLGGGFPADNEASREECSSDACQGALSAPAPLLVPGSVSQAAGENVPPPERPATQKKHETKKKRRGTAKRVVHARHSGRKAAQRRGRR